MVAKYVSTLDSINFDEDLLKSSNSASRINSLSKDTNKYSS